MGFWDIWGPILGNVTVVGAVLGLIGYLVRLLVNNERRYAEKAISEAEKSAAAAVIVANTVAAAQISDLKTYQDQAMSAERSRGDELQKTTDTLEFALKEATEALRKSIESNKIVDHFFSSYLPKSPSSGDDVRGKVDG